MLLSPWNAYAPFYDWENAQTFGRRDVAFWRRVVGRERPPALELGCGTGRLLIPLARAGVAVTGVDFAGAMLVRARARARELPPARRPRLVRADATSLPFPARSFGVVLAPYGFLQSLLSDRDLTHALDEAARVLRPGGLLGVDLVPDLAHWPAYERQSRLSGHGPGGGTVELLEAVRQDRARRLTMFDETFVERRGGRTRRRQFTLTFRTRSMATTERHLGRAGFRMEARYGDYRGGAWRERADAWILIARRVGGIVRRV